MQTQLQLHPLSNARPDCRSPSWRGGATLDRPPAPPIPDTSDRDRVWPGWRGRLAAMSGAASSRGPRLGNCGGKLYDVWNS